MSRRHLITPLHTVFAIAALGLIAAPAHSATITLIPGNGFADATPAVPEGGNPGTTLGAQRTNLFNAAAAAWGGLLTSSQTIKVAAAFETLSCGPSSGVLGSAGATGNFILNDGFNDRFYPVALAEALTAMNLNSTSNEISATFNARIDLADTGCLGTTRWYYGLTGPAPAGTFALYPTVMHELGHGLGFAAFVCRTSTGCTNTTPTTPYGAYFFGVPDSWSDFLRDNNIDGSGTNKRWIAMSDAERITSFTNDPNLVWDGMSVTTNIGVQDPLALNEGRLRMYAPTPLVPGSSVSHYHEDAIPNLLMEPSADADVFTQTDLTPCLLADVGWVSSACALVINSAPTLNSISNPPAITENAGVQVVNLAGIGDNDSIAQTVSISAVSANPGLIPNPSVSYTNPSTTASLSFTPVANQSGTALITVTAIDDGGTANGGLDSLQRTFTVTVNGVNDPPSATNLSAAESYTEDTTLNLVDIVVTDIDSANVIATLTLSDLAAGNLTTATAGAVTSTFSTGVWTASGPIADVNTLLAGVSFVPAANYNANFSIATSVSDSVAPALTGSKAMTGTPVNDAPTPTNMSAGETYTEDAALNLIDIVVTDVDNANTTATLTLSNVAAGSLNTATSGAVTSTFAAGVWSASGPIANVNVLLAGVTFTPSANFNANFTITTSVSDSVAPAVTGSKAMTGSPVNDAPSATNLSAAEAYTEDTALNLTDIVISDIDSATVTATLTLSNVSAGSINTATSGAVTSTFAAGVWTASGALANVNILLAGATFTPAANFNANFTINTSVTDGVAAALTGSKAMTGTAVNDAPTGTNRSAAETYTEDTVLNLINIVVTDVDNASTTAILTLSNVSAGSLSTATSGAVSSTFVAGVWTASGAIANVNTLLAGVTFTPAANFNANFNIATSISDGIAPAITGTKVMTGVAVNDAPLATNLSAPETYTEDTALDLTDIVTSDIDSATLTATLTLSNVAAGSINTATSGAVTSTFVGGVWTASGAIADVNTLLAGATFTPAANFNANFNLTSSVSDGVAAALTGSKSMTGVAVDDAPVASNFSPAAFNEDVASTITLVYADVENHLATACAISTPTNVTVSTACSCNGSGVCTVGVTGTPLNYNGAASFDFTVTANTLTSASATASLTITPVNDAPTINSSAATTAIEDTLYSYNATRNDPDGPDQAWNLQPANSCAGSIVATTGVFTFTPAGPVPPANCVLAVRVCDTGSPNLCATQNTNLSITAVNDTPAISSSAPTTATEDTLYTYSAVRNDPDGPGQAWSLLGTHTCGGSITPSSGVLTFTPAGPVPPASCVAAIQLCDGATPNLCTTQNTTVTITAVNDAPTSVAPATATTPEDSTLVFTAGNTLSVADGDNTSLTLTLTVSTGGLTMTTLTGLSFTTGDGTADPTMTFSGTLANLNAALATLRLTTPPDYNGMVTLTFSTSDGVAAAVVKSVAVTVSAVFDVVSDSVTTNEDTAITFNAITGTNGASPDNFEGSPTLTSITQGTRGAATFLANGSITYTPNANLNGPDNFTYTVTSGGAPESGSITVNVTAVNDAPTLNAIPDPAPLGVSAGLQTINFSGVGAGPLESSQTLTVTALSSNVALIPNPTVSYTSPNATGSISYTPVASQTGSAIITVRVTDNGGTSNGGVNTFARTFTQVVAAPDQIFKDDFE